MGSAGSFGLKGYLSLDTTGFEKGAGTASKATEKLRLEMELASRAQARWEDEAAKASAAMKRYAQGTDEFTAAKKRLEQANKAALASEDKLSGVFDRLALSSQKASAATAGFGASMQGAYTGLSRVAMLIPGIGIGGLIALLADGALAAFGFGDAMEKAAEKAAAADNEMIRVLTKNAERLKALRRELGIIGVGPAAAGMAGRINSLEDLDAAKMQLERLKVQRTALEGGQGESMLSQLFRSRAGPIIPDDKTAKDKLKTLSVEIAAAEGAIREFQLEAVVAGKKLDEVVGKQKQKDADELKKKLEGIAKVLADINSRNMDQLFAADQAEREQGEGYQKSILDNFLDRIKIDDEIAKKGRMALLTSGDDEVKGGLKHNDKIAKKIIDDFERVEKQNRASYERMIDDVRSGAGHVFDSMFQKGKSVFESLTNLIEGLFQTMARRIFQNLAQMIFAPGSMQGGLGGLFSGVFGIGSKGLGGGGAAGAAGAAKSGAGGISGFFGNLFGGGGASAASGISSSGAGHSSYIPFGANSIGGSASAASSGLSGFAGSAAGGAALAGGTVAGLGLLTAGAKKGNVLMSTAGGVMAGMSAGFSIGASIGAGGGPIGMAIGAGVGALAGILMGVFGGGEAKRARERARRADIQSGYGFEGSTSQNLFSAAGGGMGADVETDFTGRLRALPKLGGVTIIFERDSIRNDFISGERAEEVAPSIIRVLNREMMQGSMSSAIAEATS